MKNKFGAFGAKQFSLETLVGGRPGTTIFQNPGGGGGAGGGSHTRTGPGHPPVQGPGHIRVIADDLGLGQQVPVDEHDARVVPHHQLAVRDGHEDLTVVVPLHGGDLRAGASPGTAPSPCVTFRLVDVPLRGPGQSPILPFACCVGSLRSVSRCGRCSCRCRFRVRGAQ